MACITRRVLLCCFVSLAGCWGSDEADSARSAGGFGGNGASGGSAGGGSGGGGPSCGALRFPSVGLDAAAPRSDAAIPASDASTDGAIEGPDAATDAAAGPSDASVDGAVARGDAGADAGSFAPMTDGAVSAAPDAQVPVSCDPDGGIGMPLHGTPCSPERCDFVLVDDCAASCNTCSDGIARWVTSCGLPMR